MTRKSKREIERLLDELEPDGDDDGQVVVWEDPETGEWYDTPDRSGESVDPDGEVDVVVRRSVVMLREDAEEAGREILGPAEGPSIPPENDAVRVAREEP